VLLGGSIGAGAGFFIGGVGALPGAAIGASAGAQAANWVLALLGLKSLLEGLGETLWQALNCYERSVQTAWGSVPGEYGALDPHRLPSREPFAESRAARELAEGHVLLVVAVLSALVVYLTRGKGDKAQLLVDIRNSKRLGPKVADWLALNEGKLREHPALQPRRPQAAQMPPPARSAEPAMTPSQLRKAREEGPPEGPKPRMPQKKVRCFEPNDLPQAKIPEFDRQLAGQENGINDMTVDEYLKGREAFDPVNRDPNVARQARTKYQENITTELTRQHLNEGMLPQQAKVKAAEMAAEKMKTLAALHNPDMVAGGKDAIADFGDRNVNARIGAQWNAKNRIADLDDAAKGIAPVERSSLKMNAKLERCK
jgi:hypothetical protein